MKGHTADIRLIIGLILAHFLIFFSFQDKSIFWYIFTASLLLLITYASFQENIEDEAPIITYISVGVISGFALYGIFWIGYEGILTFHLPGLQNISRLYRKFAPSFFWQYLALLLVAAPGEELFWRGFVQNRLMKYFNPGMSILISTAIYASVQIYSGSLILVFAAFLTGLAWGALFFWKKSIPMTIVSHMIFLLMLFIIHPLK